MREFVGEHEVEREPNGNVDVLAETATAAACAEAGEGAKTSKSKIWLGDLDSNQDSRSQSPMFYR